MQSSPLANFYYVLWFSLSGTLSNQLFCMGKKNTLTTDVLLARHIYSGAGYFKLWAPPQKHIHLNDIWSYRSTAILCTALCEEKTETLPAFHAFSGSDTGRFSQIDIVKTIWLKIYTRADPHAVKALGIVMMISDVHLGNICVYWLCIKGHPDQHHSRAAMARSSHPHMTSCQHQGHYWDG